MAKLINTLARDGDADAIKIWEAAFQNSWGSIWRTEDVARIRDAIGNSEGIRKGIVNFVNKNSKYLDAFTSRISSKSEMRFSRLKFSKARQEAIQNRVDKTFSVLTKIARSSQNIQAIFSGFINNENFPKNLPKETMEKITSLSQNLGSLEQQAHSGYSELNTFKHEGDLRDIGYNNERGELDRVLKNRDDLLGKTHMAKRGYTDCVKDCNKVTANLEKDFQDMAALAKEIVNSADTSQKETVKGLVTEFVQQLVKELAWKLPSDAIDKMPQREYYTNTVNNATEHAADYSKTIIGYVTEQFKTQCSWADWDNIVIKTQATKAYKNMNDKINDHKNHNLVLLAQRLPKFQKYLDTSRQGTAVIKVLNALLKDGKITQEVCGQCKEEIASGQQQLSQLPLPNFQDKFPDIFAENEKISDELGKFGEQSSEIQLPETIEGCVEELGNCQRSALGLAAEIRQFYSLGDQPGITEAYRDQAKEIDSKLRDLINNKILMQKRELPDHLRLHKRNSGKLKKVLGRFQKR